MRGAGRIDAAADPVMRNLVLGLPLQVDGGRLAGLGPVDPAARYVVHPEGRVFLAADGSASAVWDGP